MSEPHLVTEWQRNPEVTWLLETYLRVARTERINHVAISMCRYRHGPFDKDNGCCDFAGDIGLEESQMELLGKLTEKLQVSIDNWKFPPSDPSLDASYVRYNMLAGPQGFDFLVWLIDAEMTRVREKAPAPLRVAFWMGKDGAASHRLGWLNNVYRPALAMIGGVEDSVAVAGRCKDFYLTRDIVEAVGRGEAVPRWKPQMQLNVPKAPVTITLREADYWPKRNSNLEAWIAFADWLSDRDEHVVFVRDTKQARDTIPGHFTYPTASLNMHHRLALYESAKCNLFVSNGPWVLAAFGTRPWLAFIAIEADGAEFYPAEAGFWAEKQGLAVGGQYPWQMPSQRFVWKPDNFENLVDAWQQWEAEGHGQADVEMRMVPQSV